jgi:pyruvate dehydrogenase E1 component beta subunit
MSYLGAIGAAQREAMEADPRVVIIGEDVEANVYGTTGGSGKARKDKGDFLEMFGRNRIRNTPISEEVIVGAAIGAAMTGLRPIVDLSYSSFLYMAMDQFVNQAAKNRYMFGGQASIPVVFRSAMFYGLNTGAHHSDRPYPMFMNVPGLKIIVPASPSDAKGLLRTAIDTDDPVLTFEACTLWGTKEEVPDEEYRIPFGQARTVRNGGDVTIVAIASAVPEAVKAAESLAEQGSPSRSSTRELLSRSMWRPSSGPSSAPGGSSWPTRRTAPAAPPRRSPRSSRRRRSTHYARRSSGSPPRTRRSRSARPWRSSCTPAGRRSPTP